MQSARNSNDTDRRGFLKRVLTVFLGVFAALVPVGVVLRVLSDPLRQKTGTTAPVLITSLDALPADGVPRKFSVIASKQDAWNRFSKVPIGAVYLRRSAQDKNKVDALNVVCPHAGCFVDFSTTENQFLCPCHKSSFRVDGAIANAGSPSPRGLDALNVEVRKDGSVWVEFKNFEAGRVEKVPVA
jgi:Rieske Fe-S protein